MPNTQQSQCVIQRCEYQAASPTAEATEDFDIILCCKNFRFTALVDVIADFAAPTCKILRKHSPPTRRQVENAPRPSASLCDLARIDLARTDLELMVQRH
ncbi:hypothetical protein Pla52o_10990 [Novipirellula galeiformis]|uniref:Uncharacterized protein n=1 Tax=Novipirellula galeiformis TaxID=2528004 RepID=A0A5C6CUA5_9BACT|nr:hypothetical protein Pla52o_10990 [Novipirellula galeiformis]